MATEDYCKNLKMIREKFDQDCFFVVLLSWLCIFIIWFLGLFVFSYINLFSFFFICSRMYIKVIVSITLWLYLQQCCTNWNRNIKPNGNNIWRNNRNDQKSAIMHFFITDMCPNVFFFFFSNLSVDPQRCMIWLYG